jgi:hypothetical protein
MSDKTVTRRADRILGMLRSSYPGKRCYDADGGGMHFVCEVEPVPTARATTERSR